MKAGGQRFHAVSAVVNMQGRFISQEQKAVPSRKVIASPCHGRSTSSLQLNGSGLTRRVFMGSFFLSPATALRAASPLDAEFLSCGWPLLSSYVQDRL